VCKVLAAPMMWKTIVCDVAENEEKKGKLLFGCRMLSGTVKRDLEPQPRHRHVTTTTAVAAVIGIVLGRAPLQRTQRGPVQSNCRVKL
jgi:hypothetical protein